MSFLKGIRKKALEWSLGLLAIIALFLGFFYLMNNYPDTIDWIPWILLAATVLILLLGILSVFKNCSNAQKQCIQPMRNRSATLAASLMDKDNNTLLSSESTREALVNLTLQRVPVNKGEEEALIRKALEQSISAWIIRQQYAQMIFAVQKASGEDAAYPKVLMENLDAALNAWCNKFWDECYQAYLKNIS